MLIYRGAGVINIAIGAIAMVGAYVFWAFKTGYFGFHLSTAPAFVLTLVCMAVLGVLIELLDLPTAPERVAARAGSRPRSVSCSSSRRA